MGDLGLGLGEEVDDGLLDVGREEVPVEVGHAVGIEGEVSYAREGAEHGGEECVGVSVGGRGTGKGDVEGPHDFSYVWVSSEDVSELFIAGFGGGMEGDGDG
jgi:hypothetical protein